jgi:hypothetical protein
MGGNERDDRILSETLRAIAEDDRRVGTSPHVRQRLLLEVQSIARGRGARVWIGQLVMAAALVTAVVLPVWYAALGPSDDGERAPGERIVGTVREEATEFFPLPYSEVPAPGGYMVRMQVPRSALTSFGVTGFGAPGDASPTVLAEVLVGGDGLARAVRFVHVVESSQRQEQQ